MTHPLVSAILPSHNAAGFIAATLDSLDAQTWPSLEIVVGDDASTDATPDILRAWAASRPHVTLVLRERNLGWVANSNDLMARARGEFMFFAFHDDQYAPTYVEELTGALLRDGRAPLAYSVVNRVSVDGSRRLCDGKGSGLQPTAMTRATALIMDASEWWVPHRGVFRAEAFRRIGGMKRHAAGEVSADFPWQLHMALLGRFAFVPRPLCTKVFRKDSLARSWTHSKRTRAESARSAAREIAASDLPWPQKAALRLLLRAWPRIRHVRDRVRKRLPRRTPRPAGPA